MYVKSLFVAAGLAYIAPGQVMADTGLDSHLLGDLGGLRTQLSDAGVDVSLGYTFETGGNLSGGDRHATSYADQTVFGVNANLERLLNLKGGSVHLTLVNRGGQSQNISSQAGINQLMQSIEVYGRGRVTRVSALYYEQKLLDDTLDIKLGRLNIGSEFGDYACEFSYLGFCSSQPGNFNSTLYNWPISQWAITSKYQFAPEWYVKAGVYQMNPNWLDNDQNWNLGSPHGTEGLTMPLELGGTPTLNGYKGSWKFGVWYDTVGGDDLALNKNGVLMLSDSDTAKQHSHKSGAYLALDQQIATLGDDASRRVNLFANFTLNDADVTTVSHSFNLGVVAYGPFAARPNDQWGAGLQYLQVSEHLTDVQRLKSLLDGNSQVQEDEAVFASYYKALLTPYFALRPEIQYIHNPGGITAQHDAWMVTLKGSLDF